MLSVRSVGLTDHTVLQQVSHDGITKLSPWGVGPGEFPETLVPLRGAMRPEQPETPASWRQPAQERPQHGPHTTQWAQSPELWG